MWEERVCPVQMSYSTELVPSGLVSPLLHLLWHCGDLKLVGWNCPSWLARQDCSSFCLLGLCFFSHSDFLLLHDWNYIPSSFFSSLSSFHPSFLSFIHLPSSPPSFFSILCCQSVCLSVGQSLPPARPALPWFLTMAYDFSWNSQVSPGYNG